MTALSGISLVFLGIPNSSWPAGLQTYFTCLLLNKALRSLLTFIYMSMISACCFVIKKCYLLFLS
jgi:hypothetical protein